MAEALTIARPYAEAVFKRAIEKDANQTLPLWSDMLQFAAAIAADERMLAVIGDPAVSAKRLGELLIGICGDRLNGEGRNFMLLLVENGRVEILPQVSQLFEQLKTQHEGVLVAKIASAFVMSDAQLKELTTGLETRFKRKITAEVSVDPELIGGVKVEIGDEVLDASVRGKLEAMAVALKS